jgi:very-short-patch-repair endonuclease
MRSFTKTHNQARTLRRAMTPPEAMLWTRLRPRQPGGPRIRRQHPIGPYIADFYCADARLVIEIDGWGHNMGDAPERDAQRDAWMAEQSLTVVRYPAIEVFKDANGVADGIWDTCLALAGARKGR